MSAVALELYRWNVRASSLVMEYVSYIEVLVRNAMDHVICAWLENQPVHSVSDWIIVNGDDPLSRIRRLVNTGDKDYFQDAYITAMRKQKQWKSDYAHPRHGDHINRDDVFSQLTFGTWDGMLSRSSSDPELAQVLMNAFPEINRAWMIEQKRMPNAVLPDGSDSSGDGLRLELTNRLRNIRNVRNRAVHEENLLRVDFPQLRRNMLFVLGAIGAEYIRWAFPDYANALKALTPRQVIGRHAYGPTVVTDG